MPKIFLESGESYELTGAAEVFAVAGDGTESVSIKAGVTGVVVDQSVEKVELAGKVAEFTYKQAGNSVEVYDAAGKLVTKVPLQEDGTDLAFGDGTVSVKLDGATMKLGGTALTETAAAVVPTTIDATKVSSVATTTPTGTSFAIDVASATLAEGNTGTKTVEFTIKRSGDLTTADTVTIGTSGTASSGSDYAAPASTTVSFAPSATEQKVTLTINGDTVRESDETLIVTLSAPSKGTLDTAKTAATLTITNDDANLVPSITVPASGNAFIGQTSTISGFSVADADDNVLTVEVKAEGTSLVSITPTGSVSAAASTTSGNTVTFTGTETDVNTVLGNLSYISNSTVAGSEVLTVKVTDPLGATKTETLTLNIGESKTLTSSNDNLVGGAGDDQFSGTLANLGTSDTITGGAGAKDTLKLTEVGASPTPTAGKVTQVEVLDVTSISTALATDTYSIDGALFNNELDTIIITDGDSTVSATNADAITISDFKDGGMVDLKSTFIGSLSLSVKGDDTGSADDLTVKLAGGATLATLTIADDMETVTLASDGTSKNIVTAVANVGTGASTNITITGTQALDLTTGTANNADFGIIDGSAATGALTINAATDATATTIKGGSANDTITGGDAADNITGGKGVDSITGGDGTDTFVFAAGDTGATTTTADTLADLGEGDLVKFTHSGFTFAAGDTLKTSASSATTAEIYIDTTNKQIVIETSPDGSTKEVINIPTGMETASYTYDATAAAFTVGAAPLNATNTEGGVLTLIGKAIGSATISVDKSLTPTLNSTKIGTNAVTTVDASAVGNVGVTITTDDGNANITTAPTDALTLIGSAQPDTIMGSIAADTITGGAGIDHIILNNASTIDTITDIASASGGDIIDVDFSDIVTDDGAVLSDGNSAAVDASTTIVIKDIPASVTTIAAGDVIMAMTGAVYTDAAAFEVAIESGGASAITLGSSSGAGDDYLFFWSDGTDGHFGMYNEAGTGTSFTSAGVYTELLTLTGVNTFAAIDAFVAGNFNVIA